MGNMRDIGIIWADYQQGNFYLPEGLTNEEFTNTVLQVLSVWDSLWFVEDRSARYSAGTGPVSLMAIRSDGWRVEPHVHHFAWATSRQKLRVMVSIFQFLRYNKDVGIVLAIIPQSEKRFFDHVSSYGVLYPKGGEIQGALPSGTGFMYTVRGKRECHSLRQPAQLSEQ